MRPATSGVRWQAEVARELGIHADGGMGQGEARAGPAAQGPVFHQAWPLTGAQAVQWRPPPGAADDHFLQAACRFVEGRAGAA